MALSFSVSNDCDFLTRPVFQEIHSFFAQMGMPASDSFWLFDPSGGDMALFTHKFGEKTPNHMWILDQINQGRLDTIHSAGAFGAATNRGWKPERKEIELALDYLSKHAVIPKVHTNHGDSNNVQNIGYYGATYQLGDVLDSSAYCLDLYVERGVEFFWLDNNIIRDSSVASRVITEQKTRDGRTIKTFNRFLSKTIDHSPNALNVEKQFNLGELKSLISQQQESIFYTHWGCGHKDLTPYAIATKELHAFFEAWEKILSNSQNLGIEWLDLYKFLKRAESRTFEKELERIGKISVEHTRDDQDQFFFNQYNKRPVDFYFNSLSRLTFSGERALDAGCGVGQWSYALSRQFDEIHGVEINEAAIEILKKIQFGMGIEKVSFSKQSIESLNFPDAYFDFVFCFGVIFCTNFRKSLSELLRVSRKTAGLYFSLNGDGWYEFLIDERFKNSPIETVSHLAEPLFNAYISRSGGLKTIYKRIKFNIVDSQKLLSTDKKRDILTNISREGLYSEFLHEYSDRVIDGIYEWLVKSLMNVNSNFNSDKQFYRERVFGKWSNKKLIPSEGIGSWNRAILPREFELFLKEFPTRNFVYGPELTLLNEGNCEPIHPREYNQHLAVWECIFEKR